MFHGFHVLERYRTTQHRACEKCRIRNHSSSKTFYAISLSPFETANEEVQMEEEQLLQHNYHRYLARMVDVHGVRTLKLFGTADSTRKRYWKHSFATTRTASTLGKRTPTAGTNSKDFLEAKEQKYSVMPGTFFGSGGSFGRCTLRIMITFNE